MFAAEFVAVGRWRRRGSVDCVTLMPSITPSFPILGPSFRRQAPRRGGRQERGEDGIKARKSSVSKMNGAGIDDAEERGVRALARERVSKNLPARRASAVGEKSLMDHSFLFGAAVLLLAYPGDACRSVAPTSFRSREFMSANGIPDCSFLLSNKNVSEEACSCRGVPFIEIKSRYFGQRRRHDAWN